MPIVCGYEMHLYCENGNVIGATGDGKCKAKGRPFEDIYTGGTYLVCASDARNEGWKISADKNKAWCPYCSDKKQKRIK